MDAAATLIGVVVGVLTSLFTAAISYGVHKAKLDRVEKAIEACVSHELMIASITPIKEDIHELKTDIKSIVRQFCGICKNFDPKD